MGGAATQFIGACSAAVAGRHLSACPLCAARARLLRWPSHGLRPDSSAVVCIAVAAEGGKMADSSDTRTPRLPECAGASQKQQPFATAPAAAASAILISSASTSA
eukprot:218948-Pleurochrysis_carterae.AAC.1